MLDFGENTIQAPQKQPKRIIEKPKEEQNNSDNQKKRDKKEKSKVKETQPAESKSQN